MGGIMLDVIAPLVVENSTKIVLLSLDGLGGLPHPDTGKSEMETARLPHLDALATRAACGLIRHVAPGITPGSGPGHLGLFGYDPLFYQVGRALESEARPAADAVNAFVSQARRLLADERPANMVLLRGFDQLPELPRFPEVFRLRAAAVAAYPMYRGLARVVGMETLKTGAGFADEVVTLRQHWETY